MPRSREQIAEEICISLGCARRKDVQRAVLSTMALVAEQDELLARIDVKKIREIARSAQKALVTFYDFPELTGIGGPLRQIAALNRATGPDKRFNHLQWLCAHQAHVLIKQFSDELPVSSQNGNMHAIAQLLFEAVAGQPCSERAGLLRAVKKVKYFQEHIAP
jgi:hypothetical protein